MLWFFSRFRIAILLATLALAIIVLLISGTHTSRGDFTQTIVPSIETLSGQTRIERAIPAPQTILLTLENPTFEIAPGDRIETATGSSASISWPDGSLTRMSELTSVIIRTMEVSGDLTTIQIEMSLQNGKTWTNVIRYLGEDSYFRQSFNDDRTVASVRGTVFEINLDREYAYSENHAVEITDTQSNKTVVVGEGKVISTRTLLDLASSLLDVSWQRANRLADQEYLTERLRALQTSLQGAFSSWSAIDDLRIRLTGQQDRSLVFIAQTISWGVISNERIQASDLTVQELLRAYQTLNALPQDRSLTEQKMQLRSLLIRATTGSTQQRYLDDFSRLTLFDMVDFSSDRLTLQSLNGALQDYIRSGANTNALRTILLSLPENRLEGFNDATAIFNRASIALYQAMSSPSAERIKNFDINSLTELSDRVDTLKTGALQWLFSWFR